MWFEPTLKLIYYGDGPITGRHLLDSETHETATAESVRHEWNNIFVECEVGAHAGA